MDFWKILDSRLLYPPIPKLRPSKGFYPSEASMEAENTDSLYVVGTCLRQAWLKRKGTPVDKPPEASDLWRMKIGDMVHEGIVEEAKKNGIYLADEVEFWDDEHKISGRVDLFVTDRKTGKVTGVEIKTVAGYSSQKSIISPSWGVAPKPKDEHVLQAGIYLDWFSKNQNVHEWKIVYIFRDDGSRAEFELTLGPDDEIMIDGQRSYIYPKEIYKRFAELDTYLTYDMLPPRDYFLQYPMPKLIQLANIGALTAKQKEEVKKGKLIEKGDWQCNFCAFKETCWNTTNELKV